MQKDVSVIIVSFNTKDFILSCLESVFQQEEKNVSFEVIVVDNASLDGSIVAIRKRFPKVKIIENKENIGFSKANNLGIEMAIGRHILFLNPDTVIPRDTLEKMDGFIEQNSNAGAITCRVNLISGELDDACHRGFPTPWNAFSYFSGLSKAFPNLKLFSGYTMGWLDLSTTHEIDACCGAFMLVRRKAGEEIGWWDEDFFWYGEDLDFCYRLKKKKWKIYYVPKVTILHHKGVSGGIKEISKDITTADFDTKTRATYARFEAMKVFYKKHYSNRYPIYLNWLIEKAINLKMWFSLKKLS